MSRRYQVIGGGTSFSSGGVTSGVIPKENGTGGLVDSALSDNGTVLTSTEVLRGPDGAVGAPTYSFTSSTNTGMYLSGTSMLFSAGGTLMATVGASAGAFLDLNGTGGTFRVNSDTFLTRRAAASWRLGQADLNGSPVAQTISVQNAITGSNLAAANWTFASGLGTGTGAVGQFIVTGADSSVASGTTAQTGIIRCVLNATKSLTSGAATTLVSIPLATLQMTGGYISVYMEATDGTSQATRAEEIYYAGENSAGVFVTSTGVVGTGVTACTATKTLTATYALTGANPALLQVTPTLTGITATRFTCVYQVCHGGNTQPTV